jgi:hypothetical protein
LPLILFEVSFAVVFCVGVPFAFAFAVALAPASVPSARAFLFKNSVSRRSCCNMMIVPWYPEVRESGMEGRGLIFEKVVMMMMRSNLQIASIPALGPTVGAGAGAGLL